MYFDFQAIKERVSIDQVIPLLGLQMKPTGNQFRGACPVCKQGGDRALVITPNKGVYYCFGAGKGGDLITLVAHIRQTTAKEAARHISDYFKIGNSPSTSTVPATVPTVPQTEKGQLKPLDYLQHEHEAVLAVGFDPEVAKSLGIGYAPKGLMRGTVAVPVRLADGTLVGYVGLTEARLPQNFTTNVVAFPKSA